MRGSAMFTTKMFMTKKKSAARVLITLLAILCVIPAWPQERLDLETISRIRYEGFRDSKVMDFATGPHGFHRRATHRFSQYEARQRVDSRPAHRHGSEQCASRILGPVRPRLG